MEGTIIIIELIIIALICTTLIISKIIEKKKIITLTKDDKDKFLYYRDLLKELSIGEIGVLVYRKRKTKKIVSAEIENIVKKNGITINNDQVTVTDNFDGFSKSEEYILRHIKFINDDTFGNAYYHVNIQNLKDKGYIEYDSGTPTGFVLLFVCLFIGFIILGLINPLTILYTLIPFSFISVLFMIHINSESFTYTDKGKDAYLKLLGLKKFLEDYGNLNDKELEDINLYDDYILYAILLSKNNKLEDDAYNHLKKVYSLLHIS